MSHSLIQAESTVPSLGLWDQRLVVAKESGHVRLLCRWKLMSPVGPDSQEVARPGGPAGGTLATPESLAPGPARQPG